MNSRVLLAISAAGLLGLLAGCPPSYPNCNDNDDCKVDGQPAGVCVNNLCQECGSNSDCKPGFKCDMSTPGANRCVPAAECSTNAQCQNGQACVSGKCQACVSDNQCGGDEECRNGACTPNVCSADEDCVGGKSCVDGRCRMVERVKCQTPGPVRFPFNESTLTSEARHNLDALAQCLRSAPNQRVRVTIEGHADERGTEQYNLALGERRANSVKKYLTDLGIDSSRLNTVSYGEERPLNPSSNEEAWSQNRRAEFNVAQ